MKYKLLAADMDGTLLNDDSVMTERTYDAVMAAIDKGVLFVPSTGRPMLGMRWLADRLKKDLPFIIYNGAVVMTGRSEKILYAKNLGFDSVKEIYNTAIEYGIPVVLWIGQRLFACSDCREILDYRAITDVDMTVIDNIDVLEGQDVIKMLWILPPEEAIRQQSLMNAKMCGRVNAHTSRPYLLEFVDDGASKGRALDVLGGIYGIDKSEMIAVGDGHNDLSMLQYAGLGIAMANSPDDIKAACDSVTLSNNEDGVAAVIEKYLL